MVDLGTGVLKRVSSKKKRISLKKIGGKKMLSFLGIVVVCVVLGSFGQIHLKKGLNEVGGLEFKQILSTHFFTTFSNRNIFFGLLLYVISTVLWLVALSMADVSFVYPFISLAYVITAILSRFYFNEAISTTRWVAILIIVGGVFLLMRS